MKFWVILLTASACCDLAAQLTPAGNQFPDANPGGALVKDNPGIVDPGSLGNALISFDTNADNIDELIIGVPEDSQGTALFAGSLFVVFGTSNGLDVAEGAAQYIDQSKLNGIATNSTDFFASAFASGDFNKDDLPDLAISVPGDPVFPAGSAGAVVVVMATATTNPYLFSPTTTAAERWTQSDDSALGSLGVSEQFGSAIAAGDFNNDAYDDLAIGSPFEDIGDDADAGFVTVLYGSSGGLTASTDDWLQDGPGMIGGSEPNDRFGWALASGDFNGDGCDDLAIGVPQEDVASNTSIDAGAVQVLYGTVGGLSSSGNQFWSQLNATPNDAPGKLGQFGYTLASGDFDNDGKDDLAIGAPFDEVCPALDQTGKVIVMKGSSTGLTSQGSRTWDPIRNGLRGVPVLNFRRFGFGLASGDMNGDGLDDLAIGSTANGVSVLFGNADFISQAGFESPPEWEFTGDPCAP